MQCLNIKNELTTTHAFFLASLFLLLNDSVSEIKEFFNGSVWDKGRMK